MQIPGYGITQGMLDSVRSLAREHLSKAAPEHGWGHALEVERLALMCLPDKADPLAASVVALLHDADDYKQFPSPGGGVPNAERIMRQAGIPEDTARVIAGDLMRFGYSKRLKGLSPETPEAKAASDADMLSIMGASGIARLAAYDGVVGMPFFDRDEWPNQDLSYESYTACTKESAVRHMFDKILRLPKLMLTEKGRVEAYMRWDTCVAFLNALFREQDAPEWTAYLARFLEKEV